MNKQGWMEKDGDNTVALDWPIDEDSLVYEIGGYEGRWAVQMTEKFNPNMHVFEPQPWAMYKINKKKVLNNYDKMILHPFALWTHETEMILGDFGRDGASLLKPDHADQQLVPTKDIYDYFKDVDIDVCLMNIEGGEYVLIPYMIGLGLMSNVKYFWAQFHLFVPDAKRRFKAIQETMLITHDLHWDYGASVICWRRKDE